MNKRGTVVLGVTGSIAAYKAAEIASRLKKEQVDVFAIMTEAATRFLTPLTLESLTNNQVATDLFSRETPWEIEHIALAKRADVFLVAPATANFIGKLANGIADDMLSTTAMATEAPLLIAPAMNTVMYRSAANQDNMALLKDRGCHFIQPAAGRLACGDVGEGKLATVDEVVEQTLALLGSLPRPKQAATEPPAPEERLPSADDSLAGLHVLISAGPTREKIDPVRYISNRSSGKMGYALAEQARAKGAEVTLVSGPVALAPPAGVNRIEVETTREMNRAMQLSFPHCDICIMAAAPADFSPKTPADRKIKKVDFRDGQRKMLKQDNDLTLELGATDDILSNLAAQKRAQFLCGFAAETHNLDLYAREKLRRKRLDMIVANDVGRHDVGFDNEDNEVVVYTADGARQALPKASKTQIAADILDMIAGRLS